jgi:hypothetical protein
MRIGIELNGVLRDTLKKVREVYEKWYLENPFLDEKEKEKFERKVISDLDSLDISKHLSFKDDDDVYNFLYSEYTMEIFGHAGSTEVSGMMDLNEFYFDMRDNHEILIVSDEIGKSKPASLFFISKFGCLVETVKFYSDSTINSMWDSIDVLLTANPNLLLNHPTDKLVIKFNTNYNKNISVENEISSIKELKTKIQEIYAKSIR